MGVYAGEQNLDGSEKVRRYQLATSIYGANGPLDVPAEDIAMCKKLIGKGFPDAGRRTGNPVIEMSADD